MSKEILLGELCYKLITGVLILVRGIFDWDNFPRGGKFPGGEFFRRDFARENLPEFLYKILLVSYFFFTRSILCVEMLRVNVLGIFSPGIQFSKE